MEGASGFFGPAVMVILAVLGGLAGYFTLRANFASFRAETERRFGDTDADRKDLRGRLEQVDRETIRREEFNRFDDRIGARLDKIEHAVNNGALKTAQVVKDAIRDLLPRGAS